MRPLFFSDAEVSLQTVKKHAELTYRMLLEAQYGNFKAFKDQALWTKL